GLAAARDRRSHVVRGRSGRELLRRLRLAQAELVRGLACAEERAREHRVGDDALLTEPAAELPRLLLPFGGQRAQLVRRAGGGLRVADDVEPHRLRVAVRPGTRVARG